MKKLYSLILALALLLTLTACQGSAPAAKQTDPTNAPQPTTTIKETEPVIQTAPVTTEPTTTTQKTQQISRDEAKKIALKHAGLTASQVIDLEVELDRDDGKLHYDVDFEADGYDYDYEIDAATGKILKSEKERD